MNGMTRREVLRGLGAGAALLALGPGLWAEQASKPAGASKTADKEASPQPFTLPSLPYAMDALAPHIEAYSLEAHYTGHHQACIDGANRILAEYPELFKMTSFQLLKDLRVAPPKVRGQLRNFVGGHANHTQFWTLLSPKPAHMPGKELLRAIEKAFGSFDALQQRLIDAGMKRFGSGWAWLALARKDTLVVHSTPNDDSPLMEGLSPLLALDVWEHAYYLQYPADRKAHLQALLRVIDWRMVDHYYETALAERKG